MGILIAQILGLSMWKSADVEIIRDVDISAMGPFENADAEDGILLNHSYVDMRGYSNTDARDLVDEEAELLRDVEAAGDDDDRFEEVLHEVYESASELGGFDIGTTGAIVALSAAGAAPISSCNGGLLGETSHSSAVPHILFSVAPGQLPPILRAAEAADVGLLNNLQHIEVFADRIPQLNDFAKHLLNELDRENTAASPDAAG